MKASELQTVAAMNRFGGSFVKALANVMIVADENNQVRIETAFPEIFDRYRQMAKDLDQYDKEESQ